MNVEAHFWIAPGVEVYARRVVPSPPPSAIRFALARPLTTGWDGAENYGEYTEIETVEFRLSNWGKGGGVAHYDLATGPPPGSRWIVHKGTLLLERASPTGWMAPRETEGL